MLHLIVDYKTNFMGSKAFYIFAKLLVLHEISNI